MKSIQHIVLLSCVFLFACTSTNKDAKDSINNSATLATDSLSTSIVKLNSSQLKNANIVLGTVQKIDMHKVVKVSGVIDVPPSNIVSISIPMGGYLKKTSLIPGTFVKKGSIIAILEDPAYIQLQQDYLTSKSKLEYLEADFMRQKMLSETKATSDKVYQLAKTDFESQKYLAKSLSEKLKMLGLNPSALNENNISRTINFYAPINGYVTKVNVNIGKYISPTDVLFEIVDPSDVQLRLTVFENDAANLKLGNKVSFYVNNNIQSKYSASILAITPNIDEERVTNVHCHLAQNVKKLLPGTFANAEIQLDNAKVDALPEEAIVKWENKPYVFIKEGAETFHMVSVTTGVVTDGFVEIKNSLDGKEIVLKNAYTLLMKLKNSADE